MNILNQYSYVLIAAGAIASIYWLLRIQLRVRLPIVMTMQGTVIAVFILGFILLRPGAGNVDDVQTSLDAIDNGKPTFLAFFSNYCTGCIAFQPIVESITAEYSPEYNILRVDIHTQVGRDLREIYDFSFTPEFILFNTNGEEIWRDHIPPSSQQLQQAQTTN